MMKTTIWMAALAGSLLGQQVVRDVVIERLPKPAEGNQPTVMMFSRMGGEAVKGAPYSADTITETTQVLADGNRIVRRNKSSFARDSQGRTRHETQIQHLGPLGQTEEPLTSVFIADPVAKTQYHLDSRSKTVARSPILHGAPSGADATWLNNAGAEFNIRVPAPAVEPALNGRNMVRTEIRHEFTVLDGAGQNARNVKTEQLGEKSFEGVSARGQRTTLVIPAGEVGNEKPIEIVTEHWFSTALKVPVYTRHNDPRFGETVTRLANVQIGEPSAHLFQVPVDYKEASAAPSPGRRVIVREEE